MSGLANFLALAITSTIPVLATAMGGAIAERARATNIAMDGSMLIAALVALGVTDKTQNVWVGLVAGVLAGGLFSALLAIAAFVLRCDIIIAGIALNLLASGLALLVTVVVFHQPGTYAPAGLPTLPHVPLGPLAEIPVLGPALDRQSVLVYVALALVAVAWVVTHKTRFGLWVQAVGESDEAALAAGISPVRVRTTAIIASGLTAGVGGAFLTISVVGTFNTQTTNGAGFIALAAIIFGRATILGSAAAAFLFGLAVAASLQMQGGGGLLDPQLLHALPYVTTIVVLAVYGIRRRRVERFAASDTAYVPAIIPRD
ncbi:ABC transporter permease [Microtetraspora fusca]|uniref:ABC transporter permease n=1 Tax=Microtetraspora fusca TaxID=1997 RepID=UPI00082E957D|nr:ABC transporter permease [Microtetraspora fusca]